MVFTQELLNEFDTHCANLRDAARARREEVTLQNNVIDRSEAEVLDIRSTFGVMQPGEQFAGDAALRTLKALLHIIDEAGFERSPHQVMFHDAMIRAISRVLYRADWATKRPDIMRKHGWKKCRALASTPRRFEDFDCNPDRVPGTVRRFQACCVRTRPRATVSLFLLESSSNGMPWISDSFSVSPCAQSCSSSLSQNPREVRLASPYWRRGLSHPDFLAQDPRVHYTAEASDRIVEWNQRCSG